MSFKEFLRSRRWLWAFPGFFVLATCITGWNRPFVAVAIDSLGNLLFWGPLTLAIAWICWRVNRRGKTKNEREVRE